MRSRVLALFLAFCILIRVGAQPIGCGVCCNAIGSDTRRVQSTGKSSQQTGTPMTTLETN